MTQLDNAVERYGKLILTDLKESGVNCWLAGGAIRDYFMRVPTKTDYDVFFPNETELEKAKTFFKAKGAEVLYEGKNSIKIKYNGRKYDLISKFFDSPQATIDAFDFTVSMFAVDNEKIYYGESSFIDLAKRQLMINKITYPGSTMKRAFRYYTKGFVMCVGEMKKIVEAIQDMPKEESKGEDQNDLQPPSGDETNGMFIGID